MAWNGYQRTVLNLAPLYTSSAVDRAVGQACKFTLENIQSLLEHVNIILKIDPTRDIQALLPLALTATEYQANFLRFSLSQSTGLRYRFLTVDAVKLAQSNTTELEKWLTSFGLSSKEVEAQARRTETCFRDILSTVEELGQATGAKRGRAGTGARTNNILEPILRSADIFGSETEKEFLLRLRQLYLRAAASSPRESLQELYDLFQEFRPDTVTLSEVMTDTAVRSLVVILFKTKNQLFHGETSNENMPAYLYEFLRSCFQAINQPAHLQWREQICTSYENYVRNRERTMLCNLESIKECFAAAPPKRPEPSVPAMEASPSVPPSALWQKLQSVESVAALTDGAESLECAICREETSCWLADFAILSSCTHVFCVRCLAKWFKSNSTCPLCRAATSSWTTTKNFEDYKKRKEGIEDSERLAKRPCWK